MNKMVEALVACLVARMECQGELSTNLQHIHWQRWHLCVQCIHFEYHLTLWCQYPEAFKGTLQDKRRATRPELVANASFESCKLPYVIVNIMK